MLVLHKNICCDPSSEPSQGGSDEWSQHMVLMRKKKDIFKYSLLSRDLSSTVFVRNLANARLVMIQVKIDGYTFRKSYSAITQDFLCNGIYPFIWNLVITKTREYS